MSKLKRVDKDAWMKCCKYCRYYDNNQCYNKDRITFGEDMSVYKVVEDGHLEETLTETLGSIDIVKEFRALEKLLISYKLSDKRLLEVSKCLGECWTTLSEERLKEELIDNVAVCYANHITEDSSFGNIYIENPEEFCCKDWC